MMTTLRTVLVSTLGTALIAGAACSSTPAQAAPAQPAAPEQPAAPAEATAPALPPADEVLDAYVEATGGRAAYEQLRTVVMRGTISLPQMGLEGSLIVYNAPPRKAYAAFELPGLGKTERATDGEVAWERSAATGARVLDGQERAEMLRQSTFAAELKWRELFASVETVALEEVDGSPAYKLVFTTPEGTAESRYFDVESRLLVRTEMVMNTQMGEIPVKSRYLDYRREGPFLVPTRMEQEAVNVLQVMVFDRVEHDADIPDGTFDVPPEIKALARP
jgi:hypothetical protein